MEPGQMLFYFFLILMLGGIGLICIFIHWLKGSTEKLTESLERAIENFSKSFDSVNTKLKDIEQDAKRHDQKFEKEVVRIHENSCESLKRMEKIVYSLSGLIEKREKEEKEKTMKNMLEEALEKLISKSGGQP